MVNNQQTYFFLVGKFFEVADTFIIVCVAVTVAVALPDFLKSVYDNQPCVGVKIYKFLELVFKTFAEFLRRDCEI